MRKTPLLLLLLTSLSLAACSLTLPKGEATVPDRTPTLPQIESPISSASSGKPLTSPQTTKPPGTQPISGILSAEATYTAGNPKSHAPSPQPPKVSSFKDKTTEGFEIYAGIFQAYLKEYYPEQRFRVLSIMNHQMDGKTVKKAFAYSEESLDIRMSLYFDGNSVSDTFQRDVIQRQNTMNRWRRSFRTYLDDISRPIAPLTRVNLDVSYDYYKENIPKIVLDTPLDPQSQDYTRCLEMYFPKARLDVDKVSQTAHAIYQAMADTPYVFQEYYIYLEDSKGRKSAFKVPLSLIAADEFIPEFQKALRSNSAQHLIQRVARPQP